MARSSDLAFGLCIGSYGLCSLDVRWSRHQGLISGETGSNRITSCLPTTRPLRRVCLDPCKTNQIPFSRNAQLALMNSNSGTGPELRDQRGQHLSIWKTSFPVSATAADKTARLL